MHEELVASGKELNICRYRFKNADWCGSETYPKILFWQGYICRGPYIVTDYDTGQILIDYEMFQYTPMHLTVTQGNSRKDKH
jgi:hypothetical protein